MATTPSTDDVAVQQILTTARATPLPQGWYVWHLRRDRVMRAALGWFSICLFGFVLLIPAVYATVPSSFKSSAVLAVVTILLLGMLGAVAFGGLGLGIADILRYVQADGYLLVMTPDDFLKVTPRRTIHVPMTAVSFVTLKGVRERREPTQPVQPPVGGAMSLAPLFGPGAASPRSRRGPPSLAFLDMRTRHEVVVATDDSFEALPVLEDILSLYAKGEFTPASASRTDR